MKIPEYSDEACQLERIVGPLSRSSRVLDIGCGTGRNLELLQKLGFTQVRGVDLNQDLVAANRARGFDCVSVRQLEQEPSKPEYDALLMSHVIEHLEHTRLLQFIESYLQRLRPGGALVVVTPLPNRVFYNDFDHVRPYLPIGLQMVFGNDLAQVQFQAGAVLELEDIRFYRDQYRLQFYRRLYVADANPLPLWVNRALKLLFFLSRGRIGSRIGWMGRYRYNGRRNAP
jgi:SAM-dependent methyltransferase